MGLQYSDLSVVQNFLNMVDVNRNGITDFNEFVIMSQSSVDMNKDPKLKKALRNYDKH